MGINEWPLQYVLLGMALADSKVAAASLQSVALVDPKVQDMARAFFGRDREACTRAMAAWGITLGRKESPMTAILRWAAEKDSESRRQKLVKQVSAMSVSELEALVKRTSKVA